MEPSAQRFPGNMPTAPFCLPTPLISNGLSSCCLSFPQMATTAWRLLTLLTLLTVLPLGLQFEIGGVDVGAGRLLTKVSSEIMKGLQLPNQTSTASQDPQHMETGEDDDLEDSGSNFDLWQTVKCASYHIILILFTFYFSIHYLLFNTIYLAACLRMSVSIYIRSFVEPLVIFVF